MAAALVVVIDVEVAGSNSGCETIGSVVCFFFLDFPNVFLKKGFILLNTDVVARGGSRERSS